MRRIAVYRVLYGEDFIRASINSILPYVDRVYVFWSLWPWGGVRDVRYKGEIFSFPMPMDHVLDEVARVGSPKVDLIYDQGVTPAGQVSALFERATWMFRTATARWPTTGIFVEPDHVFRPDQIEVALQEFEEQSNAPAASPRQIEMWRDFNWRIPERPDRLGPVFYRLEDAPMRRTDLNGSVPGLIRLQSFVYNLGYCMRPTNMLWKHLAALAFSKAIGDTGPYEGWFDRWLNWKPGDRDLEPAAGFEYRIPEIVPYSLGSEVREFL